MKKIILLSFIATIFFACKKDYTCTCTHLINGFSTTFPLEYKKMTKKEAESACSAAQEAYEINDPSATCSLK